MGLGGLLAFLWSMKSGQLEDLDGAAERVLHQGQDVPLPEPEWRRENRVDDAKEQPWE
ncbi:cbb3-type cytochrome oxidase assembly protein CcoS [Shinella sp.]|uniref:cbb3-type cytochrome oxidase assembly protein CcoS n=1 Tax=Shinella sp. TaxID=1870904 RepID=UPI003F71E233